MYNSVGLKEEALFSSCRRRCELISASGGVGTYTGAVFASKLSPISVLGNKLRERGVVESPYWLVGVVVVKRARFEHVPELRRR